jgi:DNA repair protein RecO (recombination protein O)
MRHFLTTALILRKQPSGENDWYLTLFSPEYGKIRAVSRSSRKIASNKGSHLDILNLNQFQLYRNGDRLLITDSKVENSFQDLKNDLQKSLYGFTITELLLKTLQEDSENPELFQFTLQALEAISREKSESNANELHLEEFKIKLLREAGSWPDIALCSLCQNRWQEHSEIFSNGEGQLCCDSCLSGHPQYHERITFNTVKLAKFLSDKNGLPCALKITPEQLFSLKKFTSTFLRNYLHQELYSEKIMLPS